MRARSLETTDGGSPPRRADPGGAQTATGPRPWVGQFAVIYRALAVSGVVATALLIAVALLSTWHRAVHPKLEMRTLQHWGDRELVGFPRQVTAAPAAVAKESVTVAPREIDGTKALTATPPLPRATAAGIADFAPNARESQATSRSRPAQNSGVVDVGAKPPSGPLALAARGLPGGNSALLTAATASESATAAEAAAGNRGLAACIARRPIADQLSTAAIADLLRSGRALMASGNIAGARVVFSKAAQACDTDAAFALAASYDPGVLGKLGFDRGLSDISTARQWYEQAKELGSAEAAERLDALIKD